MEYTIKDEVLGRIQVKDLSLPEEFTEVNATYTPSGRILLSRYLPEDEFEVYTVNDDGTDMQTVFVGKIPQSPTANGIRWMVYADNQRVLLGDYVLEASPDLDHPEKSALLPVEYPASLKQVPGMFRHWSEIIISPDGESIVWTMLLFTGADNFIGKLVRKEDKYVIEDVYCISTRQAMVSDPEHEGFMKPQTLRGGEVKQFVRGGSAMSLVGDSNSIADSVLEFFSGETMKFSDTAGYEETAIFSPDEALAICMSTRFSPKTNAAVIGQVPLPNSAFARQGIINSAYQYAISSNRLFRQGNIGPALVSVDKTMKERRAYKGVDLSDPDNRFVFVSPLSFSPCSTKALINMHTRMMTDPEQKSVVRVVTLLDREKTEPVAAVKTPHGSEIPYAIPLEDYFVPADRIPEAFAICGEANGTIRCQIDPTTGYKQLRYENYSQDGKTFYNGMIASKSPASIFAAGENIFVGDVTVTGEHTGRLDARVTFTQKSLRDPVMLSFEEAEDGHPASYGYATYDGETVNVSDMLP